jgi:hypothetical protein
LSGSGTPRNAPGMDHVGLAREALTDHCPGAASDHYLAAIKLDPGNTEIRLEYLVNSLMMLGHWNAARTEAEIIIAIDPNHLRAWHAMGCIEHQRCNAPAAISAFDRALAIEPRDIKVRLDRANLALDMADFQTVVAMCAPILKTPSSSAADALAVMAMAAYRDGAYEDSIAMFDKAIEGGCFGGDGVRSNRAQPLLGLGRYKEGWADNEYRYQQHSDPVVGVAAKRFAKPMWNCCDPPAHIHVHQEMGYGDTFALARYLPLLVEDGFEVSFECDSSMVSLMARSFPDVEVMPYAPDYPGTFKIPDFDYHIPMMSLPFMFDTEVDTIPWPGPYLKAEGGRIFDPTTTRRRIGLCWSSALIDSSIKVHAYGRRKSIPKDDLWPLLMAGRNQFFSLQVGKGRDDFRTATVSDVLPATPTWDDTAALIESLDLVITVDTGVAHLAAAMGKPVWLMLHNQGSWHWMVERPGAPWNTRSPWYPSVRIFRQQKANDWGGVIDQIKHALAENPSTKAQEEAAA